MLCGECDEVWCAVRWCGVSVMSPVWCWCWPVMCHALSLPMVLPAGLVHFPSCSAHQHAVSTLVSNRLAPALCEGSNGESLFPSALHHALLQNLPLVPSASCAVGLRCFFDLLDATQAPEELTDMVQGLLQVCGSLLDFVGKLTVAPALQGIAAAE